MSAHLQFHFDPFLAEQENRLLPRTNLHSPSIRTQMTEKYDIAATTNPDTVNRHTDTTSEPHHRRITMAGMRDSFPGL
ncbi:hypothetical protein LU298_08610 [Komagataeibacter intermedius]|uniref:hypothetical protein n=1 Tax=Komagataeibacter intermedius TaxID=66229 RepID=UPI001146F59D|nr:hypothetical protein [Komagataeibacter intermedius]MCF3636563.1 hypothetical protein [Komagataeibacter intermedius]